MFATSDARRLNAVKDGPSPGEGHAYTLGGVKEARPSPGEGHGYEPLGGIKESGPSPGAGH